MRALKPFARLVIAATLLAAPVVFADNIYRSLGPDGRVTYSDQPPTTGKVQKVYSFDNLPASPVPEATQRYREGLESGMKQRLAGQTVVASGTRLYSAAWCGYCRKAKAYLGQKGIGYQEIDIDTAAGREDFARSVGGGGIPLLLHNGQRVQGFTTVAYDALFGR